VREVVEAQPDGKPITWSPLDRNEQLVALYAD
jgi:hypothetical protein